MAMVGVFRRITAGFGKKPVQDTIIGQMLFS